MVGDSPPEDNWNELDESDNVAFEAPLLELAVELLCELDDVEVVSPETAVLELDE